jgi:hypothetical protein
MIFNAKCDWISFYIGTKKLIQWKKTQFSTLILYRFIAKKKVCDKLATHLFLFTVSPKDADV